MDDAAKYASALGPAQDARDDTPSTPPSLVRVVEALLFAGGHPLNAARAAASVRGLEAADFAHAIEQLARDYRRQNRPYAVEPVGDGYILALRPRFRAVAERLTGGPREARLSKAAVEVLALVAFQQPVTRASMDTQRGSDSAGLVRQLVRLGLVVGQAVEPGAKEQAYSTTARFLELFGLRSLDELPQTLDLQQL